MRQTRCQLSRLIGHAPGQRCAVPLCAGATGASSCPPLCRQQANVTAVRCQQVIISSFAISGTGSALATTAIDQDRAFFEVKVLKAGGYRAARNAQR